MNRISHLLAGAAALAFATGAHAQTDTTTGDPAQGAAGPAVAPPDSGNEGSGNEIVVLGFGRTRQIQSVTAKDIALLTPGTSPLKAIDNLPGVAFQAADAFGAYEWGVRISLRGFNQNQLGFTLDGVPLGDMSYGNVNGLHISRAVISENLGRIDVAQGAGALGTPSTSNLGGTIEFLSRAPEDHADIAASGTYGADQTKRAYVRLESGEIGNSGIRAYASYAYLDTDKWKGHGPQRQNQVNAKAVGDLGDFGSLSGFFNFSDRRETDYQDLSLDIIRRLGYRDDNLTKKSLYPLAITLAEVYDNQTALAGYQSSHGGASTGFVAPYPNAGLAFPAPYGTVDDAYFDAGGLRRDYLGGATLDSHLSRTLSFKLTGYYHQNRGQGSWITPYAVTPVGAPNEDGQPITDPAPLAFRTTEYSIHRGGVIGSLAWDVGANRLEAGGWYESNHFDQARRFYGMTDSPTPNRATLKFQSNPFRTQWDGRYVTDTKQYYVQDTVKLFDDALKLSGGWKGVLVTNHADLRVGTLAQGDIHSRDWFQPQAGAVFTLARGAEVFANYTENMRAFVSSATTGPFSTTQLGFDAIRGGLKPERSKTYEGGARFRAGKFQASAVGYYIDFTNRLLAYSNGAGIIGNPTTLQNVGAVHSYGFELTANYHVFGPLSVNANYSYNHSKYADNVLNDDGTVFTFTKGRYIVDNPKNMLKGEAQYDDGNIYGRVAADYMSKRYFTYTDDESVGGRVLVDATLGYRFTSGPLKQFSIEASVTNLTDKRYIATVGSNGFVGSGDYQTLLAGAPRQWFVSVRRGF